MCSSGLEFGPRAQQINTRAHNLFVERTNMGLILLVIVLLLVVGALPTWPYSTGWGYYPSGGLGLILLILVILLLMGRL
jgi:membrane protein YdbS with pleckstrin-like domain